MRVVAVSDLHEHLPEIPQCDLLVLGGDYCFAPYRQWAKEVEFLTGRFREWIKNVPATHVVGIAGNHDTVFETHPDKCKWFQIPWTYLQDSATDFLPVNIYGTPWQPRFYDWGFNAEEYELANKFANIPEGLDILITHSPPKGILDDGKGSIALRERVLAVKPKLHIFGHIHEGYGSVEYNGTLFANVSLCDERYRPTNPIQVFEI